jgi:pSer/pThr/pTyr-binding forkhead associated (FHA) protein
MAALWELGENPLAVGRGETVDVKVPDVTLSRQHFIILREGDGYVLQDMESQNGTYVAGKRATAKVPLRHHDCIAAGRTLFLFRERAPGRAQAR